MPVSIVWGPRAQLREGCHSVRSGIERTALSDHAPPGMAPDVHTSTWNATRSLIVAEGCSSLGEDQDSAV